MLRFAQYTERGGGHAENEDYLLRDQHPSGRGRYLCFVADGQGGRADGALASKTACEAALTAARDYLWEDLARQSSWDDILTAADRKVAGECDGFTTLIGFAIDEGSVTGGAVGDSKAYFHDGSNVFVELTERQLKNPPIGGGCNSAYAFHLPEFRGSVLVVTDGVWKYAGYESLKSAGAAPIEKIADDLRLATVSRQGASLPDDFTLLAATNSDQDGGGQPDTRSESTTLFPRTINPVARRRSR